MIDELNQALEHYYTKWHTLLGARNNKPFFETLKPTAIGWKVADRAEYDRRLMELRDYCDQVYDVWMNGRWIAKMHLRDAQLAGGIEIVKLMERRPGSTDAVGLDHVDFYGTQVGQADDVLGQETDLRWTHETNNAMTGHQWISLWFDGTEAKLRADTVLDVCIAELQQTNRQIMKE